MKRVNPSIQKLIDKVLARQNAVGLLPEIIRPPLETPPLKITLLYSAKANRHCGANMAMLPSGKEVAYTCMTEEMIHGRWKDHYLWEDAVVVGYIDSHDMITECQGVRQGKWKNIPRSAELPNMSLSKQSMDTIEKFNKKMNDVLNDLNSNI